MPGSIQIEVYTEWGSRVVGADTWILGAFSRGPQGWVTRHVKGDALFRRHQFLGTDFEKPADINSQKVSSCGWPCVAIICSRPARKERVTANVAGLVWFPCGGSTSCPCLVALHQGFCQSCSPYQLSGFVLTTVFRVLRTVNANIVVP